jgi:hypothetical protein
MSRITARGMSLVFAGDKNEPGTSYEREEQE